MAKALLVDNALLKVNPIRNLLGNLFEEFGETFITQMLRTTARFDTVEPDFEKKLTRGRGQEISVLIAPKDNEDGQIWGYLENGTDIRFYGMIDPFQPKTVARTLDGQPGVNSGVFYNPAGFPGISARDWRKVMIEEQLPAMAEQVSQALSTIFKGN